MAMLLRSTAIIICTGHILPGLQPEYVAGPFAMPDFLSCTSLLLCLTHISRFAGLLYPRLIMKIASCPKNVSTDFMRRSSHALSGTGLRWCEETAY